MPRIEISDFNAFEIEFAAILNDMEALKFKFILYFYANIVPETGLSWCPDCVTVQPFIEEAYEKNADSVLMIECPVGDKMQLSDSCSLRYTNRDG